MHEIQLPHTTALLFDEAFRRTRQSMYRLLLVIIVLIGTGQIGTGSARLKCPGNVTRLISSVDLLSSETDTINDVGTSFSNILTNIPLQNYIYWGSTDVPNQGNLTFNDKFVITQFITSGAQIFNNGISSHYISNFSFSYSDSINGTDGYKLYPETFVVDNENRVLFTLEEPIVVKKLVLNINDAFPVGYYYWFLSLMGCLYNDAIEEEVSTTIETIISTMVVTETHASTMVATPSEAIISTMVVTEMRASTVSTVVATPSETLQRLMDSCQSRAELLMATTIPIIAILGLLVVVMLAIIILLAVCLLASKGSKVSKITRKRPTIKQLSNDDLYSETNKQWQDENMVYNVSYHAVNTEDNKEDTHVYDYAVTQNCHNPMKTPANEYTYVENNV